MQIRELEIPNAYAVTPTQFKDDRGIFLESFRKDAIREATGRDFELRQANLSVSKKNVLRGIHFADIPPSQAKYVSVAHGAIIDYIVDIRVGSPTFGQWVAVPLDSVDRRAVFVSEGLGHAFVALTDDVVVTYMVSDTYNASREHGINPLDPEIGIEFPDGQEALILSGKDREAPGLSEAAAQGILPTWDEARAYYTALSQRRD